MLLKSGVQRPSLTCAKAVSSQQITGVVFEPFQEVQHELAVVDKTDSVESYARVDFHPNCEAAINEQIKWVTAWCGLLLQCRLRTCHRAQLVQSVCFLS